MVILILESSMAKLCSERQLIAYCGVSNQSSFVRLQIGKQMMHVFTDHGWFHVLN